MAINDGGGSGSTQVLGLNPAGVKPTSQAAPGQAWNPYLGLFQPQAAYDSWNKTVNANAAGAYGQGDSNWMGTPGGTFDPKESIDPTGGAPAYKLGLSAIGTEIGRVPYVGATINGGIQKALDTSAEAGRANSLGGSNYTPSGANSPVQINPGAQNGSGAFGTTPGTAGLPNPSTSGSGSNMTASPSQAPGGGTFQPGDASSLSGIANEAFSAANSNRNWEMGQNATAQGYYAPAQSAYQGLFGQGGSLAGPGAGEQAFAQQGGSILQQNPDQAYYNQTIGGLSQPGAGQQAYAQVAPQLAQQGSFEQQAGGYQNALAQPGAMQNYQQQTAGQVGSPGSFEQQAGGYQQALAQPTNAQQMFGATAGGYQAPTALESAYGGLMSGYGQQGQQQQNAMGLAQSLDGGQSQDTYAAQQKQLNQPGQLEQFAASDAAGSNPYYDQLRQTTNAGIDQEFNAGGNYNSGARFAALAKADSNLSAQQYQQEGQLQGQAQSATQSRLGQQASLAGQASAEQLGRTQAQSGLLGTADQQQLQRLGGQAGLAGDVSGQSLNYLNSGISAAQGVDQGNTTNLQAGANIGQSAQSAQLARLGLGGNLAQNAQSDAYNNLMGGANIGQQSQQDALARMGLAISGGMQSQAAGLANAQLGGQLANQSTVSGQNAYNDYQQAAQNAQAAAQSRGQLGFSDASGLAQNQAATQQGFATNASDAYANMVGSGLGAQTNAIAFQAQQAQNQQAYQLALLGLGVKGYTSLFPNGVSGGGSPGGAVPPGAIPGVTINPSTGQPYQVDPNSTGGFPVGTNTSVNPDQSGGTGAVGADDFSNPGIPDGGT